MTDFGIDISTFPDLDPTFTPISGKRVVAEAVARRWMTPNGMLRYDPEYGRDVRGLLNESFTQSQLYLWRQQLADEARKDERVTAATVTIDATDGERVRIRGSIDTADGPFLMVLEVSKVSVALLSVT